MINPNLPPSFANMFSPFAPVGKLAVGEESGELRNTPFKAAEESAEPDRPQSRRDPGERPAETDQRLRQRGEKERAGEQAAAERQLRQDQLEIRELAARDREVRAHEQAHAAVGGQFAGAPRYTYQRGPDGVSYAIAGEVSIDVGGVPGDPQATIDKAQQVQRAALAPSDPSPQDRRVAAEAAQLQLNARVELREMAREEQRLEAEEIAAEGGAGAVEEQTEPETGTDAVESSQTAADRFEDVNNLNVDINRRLIDSGVKEPDNPAGQLLDQMA